MLFESSAIITVEAPNETQAKSLRDELQKFLDGPIAQAFLRSRGVKKIEVGALAASHACKWEPVGSARECSVCRVVQRT